MARNAQRARAARERGDEVAAARYDALGAAAAGEVAALEHVEDVVSGAGEPVFPQSAVRREDGSLMVVHHGSSVAFDAFDAAHTGGGNDTWGSGFYFTSDEATARGYGQHVQSVVLDVRNPVRIDGTAMNSIDDVVRFNAAQSAAILRHHPAIYNQPDDDDNPNPLGDYLPEFWDQDQWSREEMDRMIDKVAAQNYDDVPFGNLEREFQGADSHHFRQGVREVTGHDGVIVTFDDSESIVTAWSSDQIAPAPATTPVASNTSQPPAPTLDELRDTSAD